MIFARLALGLAAAGSLTAATACGRRSDGDAVAIGLAAMVARPTMQPVRQGAQLAIRHLNQERPPGTPPFVLRTVSTDLTSAVQIATTLRADPAVVGVVGHTDSGSSLEAAPIYEDAEHGGADALVAISPTSTSVALSGRSKWLFRVCPSDLAASQAAARFALDSLGSRRAAILYRNDAYGRGWTKAFVDAYRAGGGRIVVRRPHLSGMREWEAYAGLVRREAPDLVLFPGSPSDAATFIETLRASGPAPRVLGGDAASDLANRGDRFAGVHYTAFFLADRPPNDSARVFIAEYQRQFGTRPDQAAALAYDAAMLIGRAVIAVGPDRKKVRDHVAGIGRSSPAVTGVTGPIAFDEQHDVVNKPVVIARIGGR